MLKSLIKKSIPKKYWPGLIKLYSFMNYDVTVPIKNIYKYKTFSFSPNVKGFWDHTFSRFKDSWRDLHYHHILDLFPQNEAFSLLDVGCALGDGCEMLQKNFPEAKITGIDISTVGIEKAKQKTKSVNYFTLDILTDPIPDTYDYITIIETLEHLDNPFAVIDKCLAHARKSIIISTPYSPSYTGRIFSDREHRYHFNENTFRDKKYKSKVVRIVSLSNDGKNRCIIYEILP